MAVTITAEQLRRLAPRARASILEGVVAHQELIPAGGIDTKLRLVHFLAQLAHESDGFRTTREYASGAAYEGREDLGNTEPGDGKRYRGRGGIQLTGRANYRDEGYEDDPEAVEQFPAALAVSVNFWRRKKINRAADRDDVVAVTKIVNGGRNGLADRREYLRRAKAIFMAEDADDADLPPPPARNWTQGRTVKGAALAGGSVGFAGLADVAQEVAAEIGPLAEWLPTVRYVAMALVLVGVAIAVYARWDDWRRGDR